MKRTLLVSFIILHFNFTLEAQTCQWAYSSGQAPRSQAAAIKEDHNGEYYFASNTDSVSTRLYARLEKRDVNQQLIGQKQILGVVGITDIEINSANHA